MAGQNKLVSQKFDRSLPVDLNRDFVLTKCEYFAAVGIWPIRSVIDPESWLTNFKSEELNHALYLLNSFLYFSNSLMDEIFGAAIRTLSRLLVTPADTGTSLKTRWQSFLDSALVTYVTGETPNPTDSGHKFARKARQLGINQNKIKTPEELCLTLQGRPNVPVIIIDDFVGSGEQFLKTWHTRHGHAMRSLCELSSFSSCTFYLCPAFCTEYALGELRRECPQVIVNPGHLLSSNYNALATNSIVWPSNLRSTAEDFIKLTSLRAGIPDNDGNVNDWHGYRKLGLTIAFEDSIPDATLPLFYWKQNGWRPLWKGVCP
jgi:hypothetical protein